MNCLPPDRDRFKKWRRCSPTQLSMFRRCNLRWWWKYIAGWPTPVPKGAARGLEIHRQLQVYVLHGTIPTDPAALALLPHVPKSGLSPDWVERKFTMHGLYGDDVKDPDHRVELIGYIDVVDWDRREVVDYKSRSTLTYAPAEDALRYDPQAQIYARAMRGRRPDPVELPLGEGEPMRFTHLNVTTKPPHKVSRVTVELSDEDLAKGWDGIQSTMREMQETAAHTRPTDVTANTTACGDYGGCPHRSRCAQWGILSMGPATGLATTAQRISQRQVEEKRMGFDIHKLIEEATGKTIEEADLVRGQKPAPVEEAPKTETHNGVGIDVTAEVGVSLDDIEAERAHEVRMGRASEVGAGSAINPPDGTPADELVTKETSAPAKDTSGVYFPDGRKANSREMSAADVAEAHADLLREVLKLGHGASYADRTTLPVSPKKKDYYPDILLLNELRAAGPGPVGSVEDAQRVAELIEQRDDVIVEFENARRAATDAREKLVFQVERLEAQNADLRQKLHGTDPDLLPGRERIDGTDLLHVGARLAQFVEDTHSVVCDVSDTGLRGVLGEVLDDVAKDLGFSLGAEEGETFDAVFKTLRRAGVAANDDDVESGFVLYVDCLPYPQGSATDLAAILSPLQDEICAEHGVSYYGALEYGKGPALLASKLSVGMATGAIELTGSVYASTQLKSTSAALDVLTRHAKSVVRSVG